MNGLGFPGDASFIFEDDDDDEDYGDNDDIQQMNVML